MSGHLPHVISRSSILSGCQGQHGTKWFDLGQCFEEHLQEALDKLPYLEDDIWGKLILMERNARVAKAYLRQSVITVNGSDREFDGVTLGLKSFSRFCNADQNVDGKIGAGVRLKIELQGDVLTKRFSSHAVDAYCPTVSSSDAASKSDFTKVRLPDASRAVKIFDMRKFKMHLEDEFRRTDGGMDLRRLLLRSVVAFCLVKETGHLLNAPCWFFVINMISLDMIRMRLQALGIQNPLLHSRPTPLPMGGMTTNTLGRHATSLNDMTIAAMMHNQPQDVASYDSGTWRTTSSGLPDQPRASWHLTADQTGSLLRGGSAVSSGYDSLLQPALPLGKFSRYSPSLSGSQPSESSDSVVSSGSSSLKRNSGSLSDLHLRMTTPDDDIVVTSGPLSSYADSDIANDSNWMRSSSFAVQKPPVLPPKPKKPGKSRTKENGTGKAPMPLPKKPLPPPRASSIPESESDEPAEQETQSRSLVVREGASSSDEEPTSTTIYL